jgi:hypothetical protein
MKQQDHWVGWNYKSDVSKVVELVLDEVNDILKKNTNMHISYYLNDEDGEYKINKGYDYLLELEKAKNEV